MTNNADKELEPLRERLKEIRTAKKWVHEFRFHNSNSFAHSNGLGMLMSWLNEQEAKTVKMGSRMKKQLEMNGSTK